jgi:1,2-diacylglycerol 3-beta-glucosyltransferase
MGVHWPDILSLVASAPVTVADAYLLFLTLLSGRLPTPKPSTSRLRFAIVVPAHNEASGIAATVEKLRTIDYPTELYSIVVVADNCTDDTAARAEQAGARVLIRTDNERRGKGFALAYAFDRVAPEVDAVAVVDADSTVSPNILSAFAARLEAGAMAVQSDYGVSNPNASWRTRLMTVAFGAFHVLRSRARERLVWSTGLRGNGMCFSSRLLGLVPHEAYSIVEYGLALGQAGHRVHYAHEAHVYGEMVANAGASVSQRLRWELGRSLLRWDAGIPLMGKALARRNGMLFDLAADVLLPPLSTLTVWLTAGFVFAWAMRGSLGSALSLHIWTANIAVLTLYVLRGWSLSKTGLLGLVDLACAPFYVAWKIWLRFKQPDQVADWVRTEREARKSKTMPQIK